MEKNELLESGLGRRQSLDSSLFCSSFFFITLLGNKYRLTRSCKNSTEQSMYLPADYPPGLEERGRVNAVQLLEAADYLGHRQHSGMQAS